MPSQRNALITLRFASLIAGLTIAAAGALPAQDTTRGPVRIGLVYEPGYKPGVLVLPITGAAGDSARAIIQRDLDYGDRVTVLGAAMAAAPPSASSLGRAINYDLYAKLGASAVVHAAVVPGSRLRLVLHDVARKLILADKEMPLPSVKVAEFTLPAPPSNPEWRMAIHAASDEIEHLISGQRGIAQTRMLFVRGGKVHVVDSDGYNERTLTGTARALSPVWNPDATHIAYSEFTLTGHQIVIQNLATGTRRVLATTPGGLNITPAFTPDGKMIVYAHGEGEGTDLVVASAFESGPWRTITVGRGSDNVSPSFHRDGLRLAFTSGRSGHPQVYVSDFDGTNVELLTDYAMGNTLSNSDPDWSPDGRGIVFQAQIAGKFQLMLMNVSQRTVKQLTSEGSNENASWAPDGRHIVYTSTRTGTQQLWVMDTESGRVRQLTRGGGARLGAWSPRLGGSK